MAYAITTTDAEPTTWTEISATTTGNQSLDIGSVDGDKIYVWVKDYLRNIGKAETSKTYTQDTEKPTLPTLSSVTDNSGGNSYSKRSENTVTFGSNATSLTFNLSSTDSKSGFKGFATSAAATTWTDAITLSGTDLSAGVKTIYACDNVGNISDALSITLVKDDSVTAPTVTISGSPKAVLVSQKIYYNNSEETSLTLSLASDADAIFSADSVSVSGNTLTLSTIPASVTITATDSVGNTATTTIEFVSLAPLSTPTVSSVTFTKNGTTVGSDYYTNTGTMYVYNSNQIDAAKIALTTNVTENVVFTDGTNSSASPLSVSSPNGNVAITAKYNYEGVNSDALGLSSSAKTLTFTQDGTAPTVTVETPTNVATGYVGGTATTNFYKSGATIPVTASDSGSGLKGYKLSNSTAYTDATSISSIPFPTDLSDTALSVKVKDKVGNESEEKAVQFGEINKWTAYSAGTATYSFDETSSTLTISGIGTRTAISSVTIDGVTEIAVSVTIDGNEVSTTGTSSISFDNPQIGNTIEISGVTSLTNVSLTDVFGNPITTTNANANVFSRLIGGISGFFGITPNSSATKTRATRQISAEQELAERAQSRPQQSAKASTTAPVSETQISESTAQNQNAISSEQNRANQIAQDFASRAEEAQRMLNAPTEQKNSKNRAEKLATDESRSYKYEKRENESTIAKIEEEEKPTFTENSDENKAEVKESQETSAEIVKIIKAVVIATVVVGGGSVALKTVRRRKNKK